MNLIRNFEKHVIGFINDQWLKEDYLQFSEFLTEIGVADPNIIEILIGDGDVLFFRDLLLKYFVGIKWVLPDYFDATRIFVYLCCNELLHDNIDSIAGAKTLINQINIQENDAVLEIEMIAGEILELEHKLEITDFSEAETRTIVRNNSIEILKWAQVACDNYKPIYEKWKSSRAG